MSGAARHPATADDVRRIAQGMPHVTVGGSDDRPDFQVGGKSFVLFRDARSDAVDPTTGERLDDVIVLWVASQEEKSVLLSDTRAPLFTTRHFDGHPSVLVRAGHLGQVDVGELTELVQDAWLARASPTRARAWLREHGLPES